MEQKTKTSFFLKVVYVLNIICASLLLLSYFASYVSPVGNLWWLQLLALGYGILVLFNFAFILFWILARKKKFWLSVIILLFGVTRLFGIVEPRLSFSDSPEKKTGDVFPLKVMSFNVRLFDLYNWFHNSETRGKIFRFLKKESPDIGCFQEYYSSDRRLADFNNRDTVSKQLSAPYAHIEYTVTLRDSDHWGIAIFSRYPIVNKHSFHFAKKGGNIFIYADIVAGTDTIRVFNTHLESVRFKAEDYRYFENLKKDVDQDEMAGGMRILNRLRSAFAKRARQVLIVRDEIQKSPYPVIVCGDLNDPPSSFTYHQLCDGLKDAFRESGSGFGKTYAGLLPSFRIDYIFHSESLNSSHYKTHREKISDHYPVTCWIGK